MNWDVVVNVIALLIHLCAVLFWLAQRDAGWQRPFWLGWSAVFGPVAAFGLARSLG